MSPPSGGSFRGSDDDDPEEPRHSFTPMSAPPSGPDPQYGGGGNSNPFGPQQAASNAQGRWYTNLCCMNFDVLLQWNTIPIDSG